MEPGRYVDALRSELAAQFRGDEIDRIVEEVAAHLEAAIEEAGATAPEEIEAVIAASEALPRSGAPTSDRASGVWRAIAIPAPLPAARQISTSAHLSPRLPGPNSWT